MLSALFGYHCTSNTVIPNILKHENLFCQPFFLNLLAENVQDDKNGCIYNDALK
jgi:hypothetical protein